MRIEVTGEAFDDAVEVTTGQQARIVEVSAGLVSSVMGQTGSVTGLALAADVVDGKVTRFSMEPYAPIMVFERLSAWRALSMPLLVASLAIVLLTVIAWPVSALVRRYYGVRYALSGIDARAHRLVRIGALLSLLATAAALGLVVGMLSKLEMTSPGTDGLIIAMRLFATVALPLGAAFASWNAWHVLRARRKWLAKLWALLLALACLFLLWIGVVHHVIGFGANY